MQVLSLLYSPTLGVCENHHPCTYHRYILSNWHFAHLLKFRETAALKAEIAHQMIWLPEEVYYSQQFYPPLRRGRHFQAEVLMFGHLQQCMLVGVSVILIRMLSLQLVEA